MCAEPMPLLVHESNQSVTQTVQEYDYALLSLWSRCASMPVVAHAAFVDIARTALWVRVSNMW